MARATWLMLAMLMLAFVLTGSNCGRDYPPEHRAFLDLPRDQRRTAIANYPPEEQVALYISAMLAKHPPHLELADAVAENGEVVLPILLRRIQEDEREVVQVDLLYVLARMQEMGRANVAADAETIAALRSVVASMQDPEWKARASELLAQIQSSLHGRRTRSELLLCARGAEL